jgi:hypothetical protein
VAASDPPANEALLLTRSGAEGLPVRGIPLIVTLEFQTKLLVIHSQVAVASPRHCLRLYLRDFLGNHSDISRVAAVIAETVQAKPVVQVTNQNDIVLKPDVRTAPAAATTATAATAAAAAACHGASAAAAPAESATTAATAGDIRVLSAAATMRGSRTRRAVRSSRFRALP